MVRWKEKDHASDLKTWRWLYSLFKELGADGMSSKDTSMEDLQTIYRPRILPWRCNIDDWLVLIKNKRRKSNQTVYSSAGPTPRKRIRSTTNQVSTREPPPGLLESLYDPEWRSNLDDDYVNMVLCPADKDFQWYILQSTHSRWSSVMIRSHRDRVGRWVTENSIIMGWCTSVWGEEVMEKLKWPWSFVSFNEENQKRTECESLSVGHYTSTGCTGAVLDICWLTACSIHRIVLEALTSWP